MKKSPLIPVLLLFALTGNALFANGVAIVNADEGQYFRLLESDVDVRIENQIAITVATQWFRNDLGAPHAFKYAFPMPAGASATALRWQIGGVWHTAQFSGSPQDTTLPGGNPGGGTTNQLLLNYLGAFPLYFQISAALDPDSVIAVELTYVELLPYKFGVVTYAYPNDYSLIQSAPLEWQRFDLALESGRLIESLEMPDFPGALVQVGAYQASASEEIMGQAAMKNYGITYQLSADDLGLFPFSNYFPDSLADCDDFGRGFCAFIAEPSPEVDGSVIDKVFTLIIDRSGSMSGTKIIQARDAAKFIVQHLNPGDKFNIIDFDDQITSFKPDHVDFTPTTQAQAEAFINALTADGATNISGAFGAAIPQFANDQGDTYNIIIFLTDGEATAGITSTPGILQSVQQSITFNEVEVSIFCFGIGDYVNEQLLTLLANENQGISTFLGNDELQAVISDFYLTVQNPVLLNTALAFEPALVTETYPNPLPDLFKGVQMLVVGRYQEPGLTEVQLTGNAFGGPVSYFYPMALSDSDSAKYYFLPKLWAKQKTEHLLQQFYASGGGPQADAIQAQIVELSLCYGVITPFTSFDEGENPVGTEELASPPAATDAEAPVVILAIMPNPATGPVTIRYAVQQNLTGTLYFRILTPLGVPVCSWATPVNGMGDYSTNWDLCDAGGKRVAPGAYWLEIVTSRGRVVGKILVGR